jgi:hypothetical protein
MAKKTQFWMFVLMVFTVSSCADKISERVPTLLDPQEPDPDAKEMRAWFSSIQDTVFNVHCALSGCHIAGSQRPNLTQGFAYNNIVNIPSSQGRDYIKPGDPDNSYLYIKISNGSGIAGDVMPRGNPRLSQAIQDSIRAWIENGAPDN